MHLHPIDRERAKGSAKFDYNDFLTLPELGQIVLHAESVSVNSRAHRKFNADVDAVYKELGFDLPSSFGKLSGEADGADPPGTATSSKYLRPSLIAAGLRKNLPISRKSSTSSVWTLGKSTLSTFLPSIARTHRITNSYSQRPLDSTSKGTETDG
jgi:hypothetical protein